MNESVAASGAPDQSCDDAQASIRQARPQFVEKRQDVAAPQPTAHDLRRLHPLHRRRALGARAAGIRLEEAVGGRRACLGVWPLVAACYTYPSDQGEQS